MATAASCAAPHTTALPVTLSPHAEARVAPPVAVAGDASGNTTSFTAAPNAAADVRPVKAPAEADVQRLDAAAAQLWAMRQDLGSLHQAIALWERAHSLSPQNVSFVLALTQAYFFLGDAHLRQSADGEPGPMLDAFERGTLAGEQAMLLASPAFAARVAAGDAIEQALTFIDQGAVASLVGYGQNLTAFALARGMATMLLYRRRLEGLCAQLIKLDENTYFAAPYRLQGAFLAIAPAFAGGNLDAARQALEHANRLAPQFLANKVALAELWAVQAHDRTRFLQLLNEVTAARPEVPQEVAAEQQFAQRRAVWLVGHINQLF